MNEDRYGEVLKEIRPRIIETPEEHERLLTAAEALMEKGDSLTEEEREVLALIALLIEAFESQVVDDDSEEEDDEEAELPAPHVTLQRLMQNHGVELNDVASIFGSPHLAREVLDGRRPISRGQAKQLGQYFRVPPKLFRNE